MTALKSYIHTRATPSVNRYITQTIKEFEDILHSDTLALIDAIEDGVDVEVNSYDLDLTFAQLGVRP